MESLTALGLGPQTFLAVYDGHGGPEASAFLWQRLHVAIADLLEESTARVSAALQQDRTAERDAEREAVFGSGGGGEAMRCADRDNDGGNKASSSGMGWMPSPPAAGIFSGGCRGLEMPSPMLPPSGTTGGSGGGSPVGESSEDNKVGRVGGMWWGGHCDPAGAATGSVKSLRSISSEGSSSGSPSLPQEWLFGARAMAGSATRKSGRTTTVAAASPASCCLSPTDEKVRGTGKTSSLPRNSETAAAPQDSNLDDTAGGLRAGELQGCSGGEVAPTRGVRAAGEKRRNVDENSPVGTWEEGRCGDNSVESPSRPPPPLPIPASGSRAGAWRPGGGPSRPLATAGLPAEGGGYGVRTVGGEDCYDSVGSGGRNVRREKMKAPSALDRYKRARRIGDKRENKCLMVFSVQQNRIYFGGHGGGVRILTMSVLRA